MIYDQPDLASERLRYTQAEAERSRVLRARSTASLDLVQNLGSLAAHYQHVEAGALLAMAQAGITPGSPMAEEISRLAAEREASDDDGGLFKDIGDIVTAPVRAAAEVGKDVAGIAADIARPIIRTAMVALETPIQEVVGVAGDIITGENPLRAHSTGFIALDDFLDTVAPGGPKLNVDLGSGFFSGGDVRTKQAQVMRQIGKEAGLGNQGFTIGRWFANDILEPGSLPHRLISGTIDAGVNVFADPVNWLGIGLVDEPLKGRKLLTPAGRVSRESIEESAGLVHGLRKTALPETVHEWVFSKPARRVWQWMADEKNFERLWAATGRGKIDPHTLSRIADAETEAEVIEAVAPIIGLQVRNKPSVPMSALPGVRGTVARAALGGFETVFGKPVNDVRLFGSAPQGIFDLRDDSQMVENIDRVLRNAKVDSATRGARMREYLDATAGGPQARYETIRKIYDEDIFGKLADEGVDPKAARRVTTLFFDRFDQARAYWLRELGDGSTFSAVVADELGIAQQDPHLIVEALNNVVELPDFRDVRRALSPLRKLTANKQLGETLPIAYLDAFQNRMWKRTALMRFAYPIRVIGEEQLRMAATGYESLFRHPLSYISWAVAGSEARLAKTLEKLPGVAPKGGSDVLLQAFDADAPFEDLTKFQQALVRQWAGWVDEPAGFVASKGTARYGPADDPFVDSWANELAKYAADPVMTRVALGGVRAGDRTPAVAGRAALAAEGGIDGLKDWFFDGPGRKFREWVMENPKRAGLADRSEADAFIDTFGERLSQYTLDDPTLREAISTGRWDGEALVKMTERGPRVHKGFKRYLSDKVEAGEVPPEFLVKGDRYLKTKDGMLVQAWNDATDWAFSMLMGVPTNRLSRSPTFRQAYWRRIEELAPAISRSERDALVTAAEKAGLGKVSGRLRRVEGSAGDDALTLQELDDLAKGFALDETKALLYDMSERGQFFDIARLIFPFGEAWKEVVTRWAKLISESPVRVARRSQQAIEGARGSGFFYTNANGEEVFAYPGTAFITDKLLDVPVPLEGRVQGLSLATEVLPGFGPVAQITAAYFLPHTPQWDNLREVLFPYGEPELSDPIGELLPSWLQKVRTGTDAWRPGEDDREFNNTVMHIASYLVTSGERARPTTRSEVRELVGDATEKAKRFWLIRGFAQFSAPSAPSPQWLVADKSGNVLVANQLRKEFFELADEVGFRKATDDFIKKHGDMAFFLQQGFTQSLVYGAPVTKDGAEWVARNGKLRDELPNVYGLFAPVGGEFDHEAYLLHFTNKEREALTPEEHLMAVNNRIARNVLERAKQAAGPDPSPQTRQVLSSLRAVLASQYPGFDPSPFGGVPGSREKISPEQAVAELRKGLAFGEVRSTPQGKALSLYLKARDAAQAKAQAMGVAGFQRSEATRPLRDILRALGTVLAARYDGFGVMFDEVLDREMADDFGEEVQAA